MDGLPSQNTGSDNCSSNIAQRYGRIAIDASIRIDIPGAIEDVFLVAWGRLDDFPQSAETRLWLYGVAKNVVRNIERSARRQTRVLWKLAAQDPQYASSPGREVVRHAEAMTCSSPFHGSIRLTRNFSGSERGRSYRLMR